MFGEASRRATKKWEILKCTKWERFPNSTEPSVSKIRTRRILSVPMWCVPHAVARTEKKNWNPIWGYVCPFLHRERRWNTRSKTRTKPVAIRNCKGRCKGREDNGGTTVLLSLRSRGRMRWWPCWVVADDEDVHSVCRATCVFLMCTKGDRVARILAQQVYFKDEPNGMIGPLNGFPKRLSYGVFPSDSRSVTFRR